MTVLKTQAQRETIAKKFTSSCNLDTYELLGEQALAKKTLHLSVGMINKFLTNERFGMISKISKEQFKIIESSTLIFSKELAQAHAKKKDYYQDGKLINAHNDPYITKDLGPVKKKIAVFDKFAISTFIVGGAVLLTGSILAGTVNPFFGILAGAGFLAAFSTVAIVGYKNKMIMRVERAELIVRTIQTYSLLHIGHDCFDGLSLQQRLTIVNKLIDSKKVTNRVLVGDIAVAAVDKLYTVESAKKELEARDGIMTASGVTIIDIKQANTNCDYCGAVLKEGDEFCTHCGKPANG